MVVNFGLFLHDKIIVGRLAATSVDQGPPAGDAGWAGQPGSTRPSGGLPGTTGLGRMPDRLLPSYLVLIPVPPDVAAGGIEHQAALVEVEVEIDHVRH